MFAAWLRNASPPWRHERSAGDDSVLEGFGEAQAEPSEVTEAYPAVGFAMVGALVSVGMETILASQPIPPTWVTRIVVVPARRSRRQRNHAELPDVELFGQFHRFFGHDVRQTGGRWAEVSRVG